MENWQYHKTYSGCPQGGIISPILANIYLHELDKYVAETAEAFNIPRESRYTENYKQIRNKAESVKRRLRTAENSDERKALIQELKIVRAKMMKTPSKLQTDKKIKYIRYADDFIIGVNGSKEDCIKIKSNLTKFIADNLKMELSEEKTLITHSNTSARFLGYDFRVRRNSAVRKHGKWTQRTLNNSVELNIPLEGKIMKFLFDNKIIKQKQNGGIIPTTRKSLLRCTDLEIVSAYNAELRGICNYYSLASNFSSLNYFSYLMEYSCLHTLAAKHKCRIGKIKSKYRAGKGNWGIPYETKKGHKCCLFADYSKCRNDKTANDKIPNTTVHHAYARNKFESRLKAKICELCGNTEATHYEIHHVHKVKDLKGKELWEQMMIAKRRKTMVLCQECHANIHKK